MTETISRGAQFKGIFSTLGLAVFPFVLIFGIVVLVHGGIMEGAVALIVAALFFFLFLNVRGTEIDFDQKQVRAYQQFIAWRWGEWLPLDHYQEIHLVKDTFYVRHPMFGPGTGTRPNASQVSTFDIILIANLADNDILLSEFESHAEATAFMKRYSEKLGLPSRDIYRELQASAVSRRAGRR